jgi:thiamine biosynthesis lipoprotein
MSVKKIWITITIACVCLGLALYFYVGAKQYAQVDSSQHIVMGTFARIIAVAEDRKTANKCIEAAFEQQRQIEALMSYHREDSELNVINAMAYKGPVKISEPTFEVLQKALGFSKLTSGAFDVTVGPLVDLWRLAGEANSVPTDVELAEVRSKVGWEKVILDANEMTVWFAVEGMKLDLGGIAKGYAIDKSVKAMKDNGALGGMVDIGGDIRCFGRPPRGKDSWLVGLQDPGDTTSSLGFSKPMLILKLDSGAVATSGDYRRFAIINGKKYSHIINLKGECKSDELASVTVISKDAISADALATAVSVMGIEKGLALIEELSETEAILITTGPECNRLETSGAAKYIKYNPQGKHGAKRVQTSGQYTRI